MSWFGTSDIWYSAALVYVSVQVKMESWNILWQVAMVEEENKPNDNSKQSHFCSCSPNRLYCIACTRFWVCVPKFHLCALYSSFVSCVHSTGREKYSCKLWQSYFRHKIFLASRLFPNEYWNFKSGQIQILSFFVNLIIRPLILCCRHKELYL